LLEKILERTAVTNGNLDRQKQGISVSISTGQKDPSISDIERGQGSGVL
jgi:hypothetical protein